MRKEIRLVLTGAGTLVVLAGAVCLHTRMQEAVLAAGERCVTVLIPSLFLFSILAAFSVRTGLLYLLTRPGAGLCRRLRIEPELAGVLLFSQMGGYPAGAQMLRAMGSRLAPGDVRRLQCVCIGCGPGFLLGTVGAGAPVQSVAWLLLSVSLPNLVLGGILLRGIRLEGEPQTGTEPLAVSLTASVESASAAMLKICGMVMAFAALMGMAGIPDALVQSLLEISCLTVYLRQGGTLPTAVGLLCFGGVCVHLQTAAITGRGLPWYFWPVRLLAAAAAYGLCMAGMQLMPAAAVPAVLLEEQAAPAVGDPVPGLCLAVMAVLLLRCRGGKLPPP